MKRTKEIAQRENEFKGQCNIDRYNLVEFLEAIYTLTGERIPNIASVFRDKVWEFEMLFENNGMLFFDDKSYLRVVILNYLNYLVMNCYREYYTYAILLSKLKPYGFLFKKVLNNASDRLYASIDLIRSLKVEQLPALVEAAMQSVDLYAPLLPDTCEIFAEECVRELSALGFDIDKDLDLSALLNMCRELEDQSTRLIEQYGLEERINIFNKFVNDMKIDIKSPLAISFETKKECHL